MSQKAKSILDALHNSCNAFLNDTMEVTAEETAAASENLCDIDLLEWTVTANCRSSEIKHIWFSLDSGICSEFLGFLGLPKTLDREMFIESAKEFMNFIVGHADVALKAHNTHVVLSGIFLYMDKDSIECLPCYSKTISTASGQIKIVVIV